jgi:uncharacterized protein with beta-barrel porin domain
VNANLGTGTFNLESQNVLSTLNGTLAAGTVNVNAGTLRLGASDRLSDSAALRINNSGVLDVGAFSDTVGTFTLSNGTLNGTGTLAAASYALSTGTVNANLGAGTLVQSTGTTLLNGTAAAAIVNVNGGTLRLGGSDRLADNGAVTVAAAGTLDLQGFNDTVGTLALAGTLNGTGTLTAATYDLSGGKVIANLGTGTLNQLSGTSTLNGTAGAGTVDVNGGTLLLGGNDRLADNAALSVASGAILNLSSFSETVGNLALSGTLNGTGTLTAATYGLSGGTVNANLGTGTLSQLSGTSTLNGTSAAAIANVNGGTLLLGGNDRLADDAALTVASGAILDLASFNDTVGSLALSGTLNGTGTLTAATYGLSGGTVNANLGAGTLNQLGGISTLNGTSAAALVNVSGGTLLLGGNQRLADSAAVVVFDQATLDLAGFEETVGSLALRGTLNGTGTLTAATYALTGAIVNANLGGGTLTQAGGVSTLSGTAAAARVDVDAGTLRLGASERLADSAIVVVDDQATLDLAGFEETVGSFSLSGTLAGTGTLTASQYVLTGATVNANLGAGTLTQAGGVSTLNGIAAAARVDIDAGTLRLGASERLADSAIVAIDDQATLDLAGFEEKVGVLSLSGTLAGTGTLTAAEYQLNNATVNANLGAGNLFQLGGTSVLNGTAAAGLVNVNAGSLRLGASNRLADNANVVVASGATLDLQGFSDSVGLLRLSGRLAGTGTLTASQYVLGGATVNANLGGGELFQLSGTSTLNGTAAAGIVAVQAGTLRLGASNRLADNATVLIASGGTVDLQNFSDTVSALVLAGSLNGTGTLTAANYQLDGGTLNANLGTGTLRQLGGTSLLNGTVGAGVVSIEQGILRLGAANRLADNAEVSVLGNAALDLQGFNDTVGLLRLDGRLDGTGTLTAGQYQLRGATVNANLGAGTLFQLGGTSVLNGTAGASTVALSGGTLRLGANERLADTATVVIGAGATLDLNGRTETIGTFFGDTAGAGTIALGGGRLIAGGTNADFGFGGGITGAGNLDKVGTGRLTLAGNFATTGSVNVLSGGLLFSGATAGSLAVRGGTLSGSGTVGQSLTLASGTLAPSGLGTGNSAAIGGFQAASFTGTGGTFAVDFGGASTGFASDFLRITGGASLSGSAFALNSLSPTSDFTFMQRYLVLQAGTLSGTFANGATFTDLASDPNLKWRLRYDVVASSVVLDVQRAIDFNAGVTGGSPNVAAIGAALNGAAGRASDDWAMTLNLLAAIPAEQRAAAFESLGGQPIPSITSAVMFSADQFASVLRQRSIAGPGMTGGASVGPMAMNVTGSASAEIRQLAAVTGGMATASDANPGLATGPREERGGLWLQGFGGRRQLDGTQGLAEVDSTNIGIAGGAELRRGNLVAGVAGGYGSIDSEVDAFRAKSDGDIYNAAVYVGYDDGRTYASAQGGYFTGQLDISRQIILGGNPAITARGQADFDGYSIGAMVGRRFDLGAGTRLALQAGALHTQVDRDGFTETGAGGLSLGVAEESRDLLTISGDARLSHAFRLGRTALEPYLQLGVRFNSGDLGSVSDVRFTGAPTGLGNFTIQGAALDDVAGVFGGGFEIRASDRLRIGFDLLTTAGENSRETQVGANVRLAF